MPNPLLSVIVPSYNHQLYIEKALDSIVGQSYRPLEIVIVDDGSTDRSVQVIRKWIQENKDTSGVSFQTFFRKNNGAAQSINYGIGKSKGDIISILNSDDYFSPGRFEPLVKPILNGKTQLTMSLVRFVEKDEAALDIMDPRLDWYSKGISTRFRFPSLSCSLLHAPLHVTTSNYVFSRQLFEKLKGFQSYQWCHDYDFILRACIYTEPVMISRHLLFYRQHDRNTISSREKNREFFDQEIRRIQEDYFEEIGLCFEKKIPTNPYAPSPYNWPQQFKQIYKNQNPFIMRSNFLSQLSLCNSFVFGGKALDVGEKLKPFLEHLAEDRDALRSLMRFHFLHRKNFQHVQDASIKSMNFISAKAVTNRGRFVGTLLELSADIKFNYFKKLALIAVFYGDRIVAILRFSHAAKGKSFFRGLSSEAYDEKALRKLKACWLDFQEDSYICRWSALPVFAKKKGTPISKMAHGFIDGIEMHDNGLHIHGWGLIGRELPEQIELHIDGQKMKILPELMPREDLKSLLQNPHSFGVAGFKFHLRGMKQIPKGELDVVVTVGSGKTRVKMKKQFVLQDLA